MHTLLVPEYTAKCLHLAQVTRYCVRQWGGMSAHNNKLWGRIHHPN